MIPRTIARPGLALMTAAALAGCAVGPNYVRPAVQTPKAYKEAKDWTTATPADAVDRGDWWKAFNDPVLDDLEHRVEVSNQNLAAAEAAYRQARALVREQRAAFFPTVSLDGTGQRSGGNSSISSGSNSGQSSNGGGLTGYRVSMGATWEPDVWGRIRRTVESAKANAQASAADLAAARLSAQGELAADYFQLRETDAEIALLQATVAAYERSLQITRNQYTVGTAAKTDVLQAETQLANAQASLAGLDTQRAQLEHAIAVLAGEAPGDFTLAAQTSWSPVVPEVPPAVPSQLLQRRPDIAGAERRAAAANAQIGVAEAAFFPSLTLTGSGDLAATSLSKLISSPVSAWALGADVAETLFDAGARSAGVSQARAAYDQSVAQYRQTVLAAFQDVEDQLAASRVLVRQYELRRQASAAADEAERLTLNQYRAGQVAYTSVVVAQATALTARQALAQAARDRQTTAVALIQALGGGWSAS